VGSISIPVEGEAGLGEEGRAEGEDGRAGDVGALVEQVREDDGGGPARAEVVARREVELEEAREEIGVGAVVPGVAAGAVKLWRGTSGIQLPISEGCAEGWPLNWVITAWAYW
jgi:hypothetical protein